MAAPAFFVPLAIAGAKIFFKFASKKAAQTFKNNYAKAGQITTKKPPKNATVTTTGSSKGQSVLRDLKSPVTPPSVRARNLNTTTLPKKPKGGGSGKAAGAAATAAGATAASTATSKDADKTTKPNRKSKTSDQARDEARIVDRQRKLAEKGGASLSKKRKTPTSSTTVSDAQKKTQTSTRKKVSKPTPPPARPKKNNKSASTSRPTPPPSRPKKKERTVDVTVNPKTGRTVSKTVTYSQHLKNIDQAKANGVFDGDKQFQRQKRALAQAKVDRLIKKAANMNRGGAALKSVPAGNKGLKKLPTAVRNRMGFMRKGGVAKKK